MSTLLDRVLFLDIETAPLYSSFEELPDFLKEHVSRRAKGKDPNEVIANKAGLDALLSRITCIGLGRFSRDGKSYIWKEKALYSLDEREILEQFVHEWRSVFWYDASSSFFFADQGVAGHNIINFDLPFLAKRMLINKVTIPNFFRTLSITGVQNGKCDGIFVYDTKSMWEFGAYENNRVSLETLANILSIPFTKSMEHYEIFARFAEWRSTGNVEAFIPVTRYCLDDVKVEAAVFLSMYQPNGYLEALEALRA